jgi:excisionase family DNA binding protein
VDRKAISITQACQSVGVSRRTIYNWMAAGKVEYVRTAGGAVRIFEDTLWREPQQMSAVPYRAADTAADRGRAGRV